MYASLKKLGFPDFGFDFSGNTGYLTGKWNFQEWRI